jgi:hypothetical protein
MDLKRLITQFTYRIEPNPGGGFIAHATDPTVPPIEAPTREEVQRKIQSTIAAGLAAQFPGLQLPVENRELKFAFHVEHKLGGGFVIHSSDPNSKPIEGASHEEIENHFAEKLINFVGKHFLPELSQALAAQGGSADIQVFTDRKGGFSVKTGSGVSTPGGAGNSAPFASTQTSNANAQPMAFQHTTNAGSDIPLGALSNAPITPESSSGSSIFRFVLTLLVIIGLIYFFLHRH